MTLLDLTFLLSLAAAPASPAPTPSTAPAVAAVAADSVRLLVLRLHPGDDLRRSLEALVRERGIQAGFVMTAVGSLSHAALRFADRSEPTVFDGKFELVSLVGTLSAEGGLHLHASIADGSGRTLGGHLVEGNTVYTTAEIVIGVAEGVVFAREMDLATGYKELVVRQGGGR